MPRTSRSELGAKVEADLRYWGFHAGKHFAADGYPDDNPLLTLLCGHSDINPLAPSFGVNIQDIPAEAWRINGLVLRLRAELRNVLVGRYCLPVDYTTGQPMHASVIAQALGLSNRTYFRLLGSARDEYARYLLMPKELLHTYAVSGTLAAG